MDDNKDYIHVSKVVDLVQSMLMLMEKLTGADINDLSLVFASEIKKSGIIDSSNFLKHCRGLIYHEKKTHKLQ